MFRNRASVWQHAYGIAAGVVVFCLYGFFLWRSDVLTVSEDYTSAVFHAARFENPIALARISATKALGREINSGLVFDADVVCKNFPVSFGMLEANSHLLSITDDSRRSGIVALASLGENKINTLDGICAQVLAHRQYPSGPEQADTSLILLQSLELANWFRKSGVMPIMIAVDR